MVVLSYISMAIPDLNDDALLEVLNVSRDKNKHLEITGMLLYASNCFVQVLEGPKDNIDQLYETIVADSRHYNVILTLYETIPERSFPNWQMGFSTEDSGLYENIEGYSQYMNDEMPPLSDEIKQGMGKATLERFKRTYG